MHNLFTTELDNSCANFAKGLLIAGRHIFFWAEFSDAFRARGVGIFLAGDAQPKQLEAENGPGTCNAEVSTSTWQIMTILEGPTV